MLGNSNKFLTILFLWEFPQKKDIIWNIQNLIFVQKRVQKETKMHNLLGKWLPSKNSQNTNFPKIRKSKNSDSSDRKFDIFIIINWLQFKKSVSCLEIEHFQNSIFMIDNQFIIRIDIILLTTKHKNWKIGNLNFAFSH